ncbi:hypothetical protein, partial [Halobacterium hubeiense]
MVEPERLVDGLLVWTGDADAALKQFLWLRVLAERDVLVPRVEAVFGGLGVLLLRGLLAELPFSPQQASCRGELERSHGWPTDLL